MIKTSMRTGKGWFLVCGLLAMIAFCGCAGTQTKGGVGTGDATGTDLQNGERGVATETLGIGDTLAITYSDLPILQPPFEGQIKADGTITLLLNQKFEAAGKTRSELEQDIRERYVPKFFKHMTVTINVAGDTRAYYIGGEVRSPGRQPFINRLTVLKAVRAAGDFTDFANRKKVKLTRSSGKTITVNLAKALTDPSKDVEVYPGDTIYVPRKFW